MILLDDREVQNRVIHVEEPFSDNELSQAAALINREFGGRPLMEVRNSVIGSMREDKEQMDALMQRALMWPLKPCPVTIAMDRNYCQRRASAAGFLCRYVAVKSLFEAISKKGRVLTLLDQCLESTGVQLFIGSIRLPPVGRHVFSDVVYQVNGELAGVLGVIATRMDYKDVIPVVDVTAKVLSAAMRNGS